MQTRLSSSKRPTQGRMLQIIGDMNALLLITFSGVFVLDLLHSFLIQHLVPLDHPTSTLSASYTVLQYFIDLLVFVGAMCHIAPSQLPWASAMVGLALQAISVGVSIWLGAQGIAVAVCSLPGFDF